MKYIVLLENKIKSRIEFVNSCIENKLKDIDLSLNGFYSNMEKNRKVIDKILNKDKYELKLKHEKLEDEEEIKSFFTFQYENTKRFLLFYSSNIYKGELKLSNDKEFIEQFNEKLKDINISIESVNNLILPSYDKNKTFLFKINHEILNNVYFSIIKFSLDGYKFYFFYDIFSSVFDIDKYFLSLSSKIDVLKSEYNKLLMLFNKENIKKTMLLIYFQKHILNIKSKIELIDSNYNKAFEILDDLKALLLKENDFDFSSITEKYNDYKNVLKKIDRENFLSVLFESLEKKNSYLKSLVNNMNKEINLISKDIDLIKIKIDNYKENISIKISEIDGLLEKEDFNLKDLLKYQSQIPNILKLVSLEERIKNIKQIIKDNEKSLIGKIKNKILTLQKELELLEKEFIKETKIVKKSLLDLKEQINYEYNKHIEELQEELNMKLNEKEQKIQSFEMYINQLKDEISKIKQDFIKKIEEEYIQISNKYEMQKSEIEKKIESLSKEYSSYFNLIKQDDINYIKFYSKIKLLDELQICEENKMPVDIQNFINFYNKESKNILDLLDIENVYNESLNDSFNNIISKISEFLNNDTIEKEIIKSIEEKFVKDFNIIY